MTRAFLRVAKVGGSLFSDERLPTSLRVWLDDKPGVTVLIAGGGAGADFIREADVRFSLGQETSHRLCLGVMRTSAHLLAALLPEATQLDSLPAVNEVVGSHRSGIVVWDVEAFASGISSSILPRDWGVTSDSIAAHAASAIEARELVLFKSVSLPPNTSREEASAAGYVDAYFRQAAAELQAIRWVNLRNDPPLERPL